MNRLSPQPLRYFLSLTPGMLVITGNLTGGYLAAAGAFYTMILLVGIERFLRADRSSIEATDPTIPHIILALHVFFQTAAVASLILGIQSGVLDGSFIWFAVLSTGINSGIEGINSAHEMIHRKERRWRLAGIWNLLTVNYAHFYVEHIQNHHRHVGTERDPATARFGESVYRFVFRTVPAQFLSAWNIEAGRMKEKKLGLLYNQVFHFVVLQFIIMSVVFQLFGSTALVAYLLQSAIAVFLLEYVNYIEHYGLTRRPGKKVDATVSWQSDLPISRFALIELSRHSDHHITASKPYYTLESHEDSPVLPSGYFGSFYLALLPPLWFRKIHPLLEDYFQERHGNQKVPV